MGFARSNKSQRYALRQASGLSPKAQLPTGASPKAPKPLEKKLLQSIFEQAVDAMVVIDNDNCLVAVNSAACQLFGFPRQSLLGRPIAELTELGFDLAQTSVTGLTGKFNSGELCIVRPDGGRRNTEYTLTLNIQPQRHLFILRDITERKNATEDELRRQHQRAELFSEVTLKIRQSLQLKEILSTTVTEVRRILQADRVLIYQVLPNGTGKTISEAVLPDFQAILGMEFPEEVFPPEYQELYAQGRVQAIADVHAPEAGLAPCLVEFIDQFDIKAKLIVPIVLNLNSPQQEVTTPDHSLCNQLWGLLIAHQCRAPREWVDFELELMQQLADQIGIAIAQSQLLGHLEEIVTTRTAELRQVNLN
ncbi:MAG: GAF domain-containing protein, partial [Scytonema sp. CRU_2_7]|nr:GAF domain-containing protein [Scytonema sp. CRU_2_7]